ncbi:MAG: hypothetical protein V1816_22490 [Pseudomonadota bacterium]
MTPPVLNPFGHDIVSKVRGVETAVTGLNDHALDVLIGEFEKLEGPFPRRRRRLDKVQLVISPEPGYGKSHLLGRLFHKLSRRANLVYVSPFEDPRSSWKSVQLSLVNELSFPDKIEVEYARGDEPTQLEALAHGVLVGLTALAVEKGLLRAKAAGALAKALAFLRALPIALFRKNPGKVGLLQGKRAALEETLRCFCEPLCLAGSSWLNFFFFAAYSPQRRQYRDACLDWLKGGAIDQVEAREIGLRPSDNPDPQATRDDSNMICRNRLLDLCKLAGFYRPFLFCFDQTENYGKNHELAMELGRVIETLWREGQNNVVIVTGNFKPWTDSVAKHWEWAHQDRLLRPPLELQGINRSQAEELVNLRLSLFGIPPEKRDGLFPAAWLEDTFSLTPQIGVRAFLRLCSERWAGAAGGVETRLSLEELFLKKIGEIKSDPKQVVFRYDPLLWVFRDAAKGFSGLEITEERSANGYYVLSWRSKKGKLWLGFEGGSNWKRWEGILNEATRLQKGDPAARTMVIRTVDLPPVPNANWKQGRAGEVRTWLELARDGLLTVLVLPLDDMVEIHAAHQIFLDAMSGNIDYSPEEAMAFIRTRLKPLFQRLFRVEPNKATPPAPETDEANDQPSDELIRRVRDVVFREKLLSFDELMKRLPPKTDENLVRKARACVPEIRVHVSPKMVYLQWQSQG